MTLLRREICRHIKAPVCSFVCRVTYLNGHGEKRTMDSERTTHGCANRWVREYKNSGFTQDYGKFAHPCIIEVKVVQVHPSKKLKLVGSKK